MFDWFDVPGLCWPEINGRLSRHREGEGMSVSNTGDIGCVESTMDIVLERLRAELAALRADAERYRWLRDKYTVSLLNGEHELRITYGPRASTKSGIDDIIDATRGGHMTRPRAALGELRDEAARRWQA